MKKKLIFITIVLLFIGFYHFGFDHYLNFEFLKNNLNHLQSLYYGQPFKISLIYFVIYVVSTALSFPGATVITLLGGSVFGLLYGTILVSFASTIGATIAFWSSRFIFKNFVESKFPIQSRFINDNIKKEGVWYLFTLRLIPVFPFFVVNLVMGLTNISSVTYFFVSMLGMLPATIVFVYAGKSFSHISSLSGILSPSLILAFFAVGLLPYFAKAVLTLIKNKKLYRPFKKPKSFDYNMMVIGGGAAGLVTSYISAAVNAKIALVEKNKMGGDCLNTGCVPSKALIKTTKVIALSKKAKNLGIKNIAIQFDFAEIMKRIKKVIREIEPHDSIKRYQELGVECLVGEAKIISPYEVKVNDRIFTTQNITIASGARPIIPQILGIEKVNVLTSETVWELDKLPQKLLIIGAGPIGCELAQCFSRLGSIVTVVDNASRILAKEDLEVSSLINTVLSNDGVRFNLESKTVEFFVKDGAQFLNIETPLGAEIIQFDYVLMAIGRRANVSGFGLEELGIAIRKNGTIETNEYLETKYPNIFACGDVTGPYQLTHTSAHQAWYCAINGLFGKFKKFKVDYKIIPWCTFTDPEVATVGMNEQNLLENEIDYEVTHYDLNDLDRSIADDEKIGFVKVLTLKGSDQILGTTIVGTQASTMILEFISAMKFKKGLNDILNTIHIYPTAGEANKYAAGLWKKNHKPVGLLNILKKYFSWSRGV